MSLPSQSFQNIRLYAEKWRWEDPKTRLTVQGLNPPAEIKHPERVPFYIKFVTKSGKLEEGWVVCLKTIRRRHQRMVQFVESKEIRMVCDYLVIEIDGTRFLTH